MLGYTLYRCKLRYETVDAISLDTPTYVNAHGLIQWSFDEVFKSQQPTCVKWILEVPG